MLDSPFNPTDRMLRQFAGLWIVFFAMMAARLAFRGDPKWAFAVAAMAVTVGPMGIVWPRAIRPIFIGWMAAAYPIGWVVSRLVLGVIFYGLFTPVAFVLRLTGRDALGLEAKRAEHSYWQTKPHAADQSQYLRQY